MTDPAGAPDTRFFGHPRGLSTLFFTEMWERFSYYGMRALLILFMTAPLATGGLGFDTATAGAIYGLYTSMVYMTTLPGGWIADRLIGQRRAVLYGGILIACGHFSMAVPSLATFYLGLFLIVIGTGLLKGNVSVIVGQLYAKDDIRRDAGFSIFYMGINLGAFIAPLVCGYLGQRVSWHAGFAAAGVGMTLGVIQYVLGSKNLGDAGLYPTTTTPQDVSVNRTPLYSGVGVLIGGFIGFLLRPAVLLGAQLPFSVVISRGGTLEGADQLLVAAAQASFNYLLAGAVLGGIAGYFLSPFAPGPPSILLTPATRRRGLGVGAVLAVIVLIYVATLSPTPRQVADAAGIMLLGIVVLFFGWLFTSGNWAPDERKRLYVIGVLFLAAALFWSVFEQAGSTLNLFADRNTHNVVLGYTYPSSWFQSLNSLFIIGLAPVFAWLWIRLARAGGEPSSPAKFAIGLVLVGAGFAILIWAAKMAEQGVQVSPMWLTVTYLLHTCGELCLSPVGLSAMTKLAPVRIGGLMMGVWFLAASVGNFIGGRISSFYESWALPSLFGAVGLFAIGAGIVLFLFVRPIKKLMGEVN